MSTLWIIVLIFIVFACAAAAVAVLAFTADKRRAQEVATDEDRLHPEHGHGQDGPGSGGPDWDVHPNGRE